MSNCFLSKYCFLCFLITACAFPVVSFADEVLSTTTVTNQQGESKQITLSEKNVEFHKGYFKVYVTDFKNIVTAPARWDSSDWLTAGIVTGIAAGLYSNDAKIQKWVQDHKTTTTENLGDKVTSLGPHLYADTSRRDVPVRAFRRRPKNAQDRSAHNRERCLDRCLC